MLPSNHESKKPCEYHPQTSKKYRLLNGTYRLPFLPHQYCKWLQQRKKEKKPITSGASSRHTTKLKQSILLRCLHDTASGVFKQYGCIKYRRVTSNALITFGIRHHYSNNECKKICKQLFRVLRCKCYIIQLYKPQISKEYRLFKVCCVPATSSTTSKAFSLFLQRPLTVLMRQTRQTVRAQTSK